MDEAKVDMEIDVRPTKEFLDSHPPTSLEAEGKDVQIEQEVEIPLQSNLTAAIREEQKQAEQTGQNAPTAEDLAGDARMPAHRRTYGKPQASGGAEDVT